MRVLLYVMKYIFQIYFCSSFAYKTSRDNQSVTEAKGIRCYIEAGSGLYFILKQQLKNEF